jgi:hypothetical protein
MNDDNDKSVTISPRQGFLTLGLFQNTHIEEYNYPTLFFNHLRPHISCSYQKAQVDLTNVTKKIAYHFTNIFFKIMKNLIHFILSSSWICIQKGKLVGHMLVAINVSNNINLNKILKLNIGYKKLEQIKTSVDYLNQFRNLRTLL